MRRKQARRGELGKRRPTYGFKEEVTFFHGRCFHLPQALSTFYKRKGVNEEGMREPSKGTT
jgi:hypothetical protein